MGPHNVHGASCLTFGSQILLLQAFEMICGYERGANGMVIFLDPIRRPYFAWHSMCVVSVGDIAKLFCVWYSLHRDVQSSVCMRASEFACFLAFSCSVVFSFR